MSNESIVRLSADDFLVRARQSIAQVKNNVPRSRLAFGNLQKWVENRVATVKPSRESALGQLSDAMFSVGDSEEVNDDDMLYIMDTLGEFFEVVTPQELDDEDYEIETNMSPDLLRLLGKIGTTNGSSSTSDWVAPSRPGLNNSQPIIPRKAESKSSDNRSLQAPSKDYYNGGEKSGMNIKLDDADTYSESNYSESNYGESNYGDVDEKFSKLNMSSNLMAALGMDMTMVDETETDWKPPAETGLSNSKPIVSRFSAEGKYDGDSGPIRQALKR